MLAVGRSSALDELSSVSRRLCLQGIVVGILAIVLSKNKRSRCLVGIAAILAVSVSFRPLHQIKAYTAALIFL